MKKLVVRIALIYAIVCYIALFSATRSFAQNDNTITLTYFGTKTCFECAKEMKLIKNIILTLEKEDVKVDYIMYDTTEVVNSELLQSYDEAYAVPQGITNVGGMVFVGNRYFYTYEGIKADLPTSLSFYAKNPDQYRPIIVQSKSAGKVLETSTNLMKAFTPVAVFVAGLLDGFNPCAIAMLLFFITFLVSSNRKNKEILFTGLLYVIGTFIAYFGIGVGLLRFAIVFSNANKVMIAIFVITILLSVGLMVLNLMDWFHIRNGNFKDIKTQLPQGLRHTIHNFIRKKSTSTAIYASAFISGVVISFLEFFCTGQIYLPTISYVLSTGNSMVMGTLYLLLYNISFVLPLVAVCLMIYKGKELMDVSQLLVSNLHRIKLAGAIFFGIIAIIMTLQIIKIL